MAGEACRRGRCFAHSPAAASDDRFMQRKSVVQHFRTSRLVLNANLVWVDGARFYFFSLSRKLDARGAAVLVCASCQIDDASEINGVKKLKYEIFPSQDRLME
mmetsp:Transcript_5537/g.12869  ORF Transcript_5537/g.12869 Transcript_5537/m.12869 type:complete len:103 (+) Transcript_5537:1309-1617(+)